MHILVVLSVFCFFSLSYQNGTTPEQIHIAYGAYPSEMVLTWNTRQNTNVSTVQYGLKAPNTPVKGSMVMLGGPFGILQDIQFVHKVKLTGLKPGARYVYRCGSPSNWSRVYNFTTMQDGTNWSPRLAIYGDMGFKNAKSMPFLLKEMEKGDFDAVLHVGDMAYDMADNRGRTGDAFMNLIQPLAAKIPYMTCVGNHEWHYNFTNYKTRFAGIGGGKGDGEGFFYSFDIGPAHIIALSTEFYIYVTYGIEPALKQFAWLQKDLAEANKPENRAKRPWIITMGHRPMYCSNDAAQLCEYQETPVRVGVPYLHLYGMEPLFKKYGVDLAIWAHEHSYERLWPVYDRKVMNGSKEAPYTNPKAPVHIITGSAGCIEKIDPFVGPFPEWSAFRLSDYGYTRMKIRNATHLDLEQFSVDKGPNGAIVDKFTIIKDKHGPYTDDEDETLRWRQYKP
ncbi:acid phosphatase type 7-like isoform X1 [Lineus longissimus]|uniref:acid phosphatase type 7-like isoform X1 n=1 Tax=Lineus longissimus TaxID=88925 RepID=UPI002B4E9B08